MPSVALPYLDHVLADSMAIAGFARANGSAAVPSCPGWDVTRLAGHVGRVHRMAHTTVSQQLTSPPAADQSAKPPADPSEVADWLAHLFVDFEPGIHYTQIQMHSSMAASPVLRLYNPVTQAQELDPQGDFVRRWVPELRAVSNSWIFLPWALPAVSRKRYGLVGDADYPVPLVDFEAVHRQVKADIAALRNASQLQAAKGFNEKPGRTGSVRRKALAAKSESGLAPQQQLSLL